MFSLNPSLHEGPFVFSHIDKVTKHFLTAGGGKNQNLEIRFLTCDV